MPAHVLILDAHPGMYCLLAANSPSRSLVCWATSEYDALREITERDPDVVVVDASVPDIDWTGLIHVVRTRRGGADVIAIVPRAELVLLRQMSRVGLNAIFQRPTEIGSLLRRVGNRVDPDAVRPWTARNIHVDHALEYLGRNFLGTVSVQETAEAIGVSVSHLAHLFGAAAGMTVKEYALGLKVELVKHLLIMSDAKLEDLAERCGFCDASHLSRVFRQYTGSWPGEFRQRSHRRRPAAAAIS